MIIYDIKFSHIQEYNTHIHTYTLLPFRWMEYFNFILKRRITNRKDKSFSVFCSLLLDLLFLVCSHLFIIMYHLLLQLIFFHFFFFIFFFVLYLASGFATIIFKIFNTENNSVKNIKSFESS